MDIHQFIFKRTDIHIHLKTISNVLCLISQFVSISLIALAYGSEPRAVLQRGRPMIPLYVHVIRVCWVLQRCRSTQETWACPCVPLGQCCVSPCLVYLTANLFHMMNTGVSWNGRRGAAQVWVSLHFACWDYASLWGRWVFTALLFADGGEMTFLFYSCHLSGAQCSSGWHLIILTVSSSEWALSGYRLHSKWAFVLTASLQRTPASQRIQYAVSPWQQFLKLPFFNTSPLECVWDSHRTFCLPPLGSD